MLQKLDYTILSDDSKMILHSKYLLSRFSETTKQVLILSNGNKNIHYDALKKFYELKTLYATLSFKGALSGLRQFLEIESPLKMMKNTFYFTSKALFVLKIFKCFSWLFDHVGKRHDKKNKVNFKFYEVTACVTNTCN